jgi:hypothetical protein
MNGRLATNYLILSIISTATEFLKFSLRNRRQEIVILFEIEDVAPFAYEYSQVGLA